MRHDLQVSQSIIINANRDKVWETLTNPEIIKEYLFGTETKTDWEVGSKITFSGEYHGQQYQDHGFILENIPKDKITYNYWSQFSGLEDKPDNYSNISYEVKIKDNNATELTWTQKGYADEESHQRSQEGMQEFLLKIKEITEKEN